ncbi:acyl-CoA dehydrogenase family protein [Mycobacterium sp. CVI_P3]|uniref:Acyl-CoA dehydrogenase family protein n=1 Tax=Mycobacterium pinniadriaticum TaxID=2994102 RepID=A0ABT3SG57_9MYCO|nr:acyl-CoA dehydrogenase family protein [Mycobacterium pinniadriaticum]MCX2931801.1 acyl-CoA dehydrogenase family protein [Mycobacterium pinniadriaticum]MCX2938124.1 acyl-CoA dehydrogenase family protein [Mycobacterium pinniadriaticum]
MNEIWAGPLLPEDIATLKSAAREFVDRYVLPHEAQISRTCVMPDETAERLRQAGYFGLTIAEEYGGLGVSHLAYCAVLEELSRAPKSVWLPISIANGVASQLLEIAGSDEQRKRYLPGIAAGELVAAIAVTEPEAGSDVQGLKTRAVRADGGWRLQGSKHYITLGARADVLFVLARTEGDNSGARSFTVFLVEKDTPGFSIAGMQETMSGPVAEQAELLFEDCFVGEEYVLGEVGEGLKAIFKTFAEERISMAITALGTARRAIELAAEYATQRTAFGSPIGDYQAIQIQLADSVTELAAAQSMTYALASQLESRRVTAAEAAMVKLYASEMVGRVADRALQIFGGYGYMAEAPISRIYRDVRIMRISGGTSEIQRNVIAKALLREVS